MNRCFTGMVTAVLLGVAGIAAADGKFVPPQGKVLVFAGQNKAAIDEYVETTGGVPAGLMLYTSLQQLDSLDEPADWGAGESHGKYLLDKYPDTALQLGLYLVDMLQETAAGTYDGNIDKLGQWLQKSGRPVYLRIGYEFDGPHNHYDPRQYVAAYRRIVDRFRANGIDNVAFVWHSYAASQTNDLMSWYPGDEYVDWFGISYFAQHPSSMKRIVDLAAGHGKPVMICESTPAGIGTQYGDLSWRRWFKNYFAFIAKYDIKCICYINYDWDALPMFANQHWKDCRLSSSEYVKQQWTAEISRDLYLNSSRELFGLLGYKK